MGKQSGALYVRVGDTWHPALNLASARLIAGTSANPQPVPESELAAPNAARCWVFRALRSSSARCCPAMNRLGRSAIRATLRQRPSSSEPLERRRSIASPTSRPSGAPGSGTPAYLLYNGQRAVVDLADTAVVRALRLRAERPNRLPAIAERRPEASPITTPRIRGAGGEATGCPDFRSAACCASPAAIVRSITRSRPPGSSGSAGWPRTCCVSATAHGTAEHRHGGARRHPRHSDRQHAARSDLPRPSSDGAERRWHRLRRPGSPGRPAMPASRS